ncbi:Murein L,D-transpeptidase YcbB/YkuD [Phyllobacterium sp. YR620]|uniref:L,D-transpeptidase family protein n=1 Tax=Phyllobacterium pellucidum TaxID=2740464 RepID=A0A849VJK8_9HYPH|nr:MULTISPECIES: L,D-transpeptidase family protein [Phyllobacterium]MRG55727.1 L,D-transpeptidase family protein [Phyllobacterium sp. SYP-B3895]NTS29942.1 L,D-transpeptidase family protein [Phyllobacterium pellucidum]UGY08247.1 L,D-transpeptidase family protein [Phyllobacterium sp. T1018]SDP58857.1 Murein L,D-transpeptidase YcbB/YkuD [Phyllobacterium sp. YR620]SFI47850.1 Murein L,D-transpeptidase YcbB/YkuD [Phyllobacterium sp. CL33Tsu]
MKKFGSSAIDRRAFLRGVATAGFAAATTSAFAQQSDIGEILAAPRRGNWDDQFDARSTSKGKVASFQPIASPETASFIQNAINTYNQIVSNGGWPRVDTTVKLQLGVVDPSVAVMRKRLMIAGDLSESAGISNSFDTYVDAAVKRFQARHGLPADGVMGQYSLAAMNVPADIRLGQLQTNLERVRTLAAADQGPRYVMVNIPAAQLEAVEGGRVVQRHTAIVGKIDRQTPILDSKIHEVILNPYWTAPKSIIEKDIIPLMRKDPTYLTRNKIRLFDQQGQEVPPEQVDWNTDDAVKLMFRQDPGKINAMSSTKINFPNPYAVYMHDTPQQGVFNKLMRFESSGCVRVQNVRDLNVWLLRDTAGWDRQTMEATIKTGVNTPINVSNPVPLHFVYVTAWSTGDGVVHLRDDIYERDGQAALSIGTNT